MEYSSFGLILGWRGGGFVVRVNGKYRSNAGYERLKTNRKHLEKVIFELFQQIFELYRFTSN